MPPLEKRHEVALQKKVAAKLMIEVGEAAKSLVDLVYDAKPGAAITTAKKGCCWWKHPEDMITVDQVELDRCLTELENKIKLARRWLK